MSTPVKVLVTPEEYLTREGQNEYKSEYRAGKIVPMTGASEKHNTISVNSLAELRVQLKRKPFRVYPGDLRVKLDEDWYVYPDVSVVCGAPQIEHNVLDLLLNPCVVIEVLSKSTAEYDRGEKAERYRDLPSLQEYLLVTQNRPYIEHYRRQSNDTWMLTVIKTLQDSLYLPTIDCYLALADVYDNVDFMTP